MPVVFLDTPGSGYWQDWLDFVKRHMLDQGLISPADLHLFTITSDPDEAVHEITTFYRTFHSARYVRGQLVLRLQHPIAEEKLAALNLEFSGHRSVDGFPLLVKEYPPLKRRKPQGRVLLIGGTHGDELSSISIVFKWMHTLEKHHSGLFHWRVNPLLNPDGALRRKHTRTNANRVDLNRNFKTPDSHLGAALAYWYGAARKNQRRYPGPYPLSEPETNWLYQEIEGFKPDVIVSVHAPYSLVDYDAPSRSNAPERIGHLRKNLMGTYPGSLGNYAGIHLGIPVITLELPHAGIMPTQRQISWLWTDLVRWLIRNI